LTTLLAFVFALLVWISHDPAGRDLLYIAGRWSSSGKLEERLDRVLIFTTPSTLTKYDFMIFGGTSPVAVQLVELKSSKPWYYVEDATTDISTCGRDRRVIDCLGPQVNALVERLNALRVSTGSKRIQGYEFYESVGSGTTGLKRGLTWKVTVPAGSEFNRNDIIQMYIDIFKRERDFYFEELRIPASRCPALFDKLTGKSCEDDSSGPKSR
jgi:hypothetical protein